MGLPCMVRESRPPTAPSAKKTLMPTANCNEDACAVQVAQGQTLGCRSLALMTSSSLSLVRIAQPR